MILQIIIALVSYSVTTSNPLSLIQVNILIRFCYQSRIQRLRQDFGSGGGILGRRPSRGSGGRSPSDAVDVSKILKNLWIGNF